MGRCAQREPSGEPPAELLCTVRGLLKKMERRVLVGDRVRVGAVDWAERSGAPHARLPRSRWSLDSEQHV